MQKIIISLIGLNVILCAVLAVALTSKQPSRSATMGQLSTAGERENTSHSFAARSGAGTSRASAGPHEKFGWAAIASTDLRQFAANLRRVGCPEETVKDIMLAEVNRRYGPQERALKVRPDDVAPWEKATRTDRRSGETKLRQMLEEKRSLLKELTGIDVGLELPPRLAGRDVEKFEGAFNAVPSDKRDQVRTIQEKYWTQSDDIKQRTLGYLEPEDREEFLRIKTERRDALAKVLSPAELQDYEMKTSDITSSLRSRLNGNGFQTTDEEFRKIFDFMAPLDDQYSISRRNPDPVDPEFTSARDKAEKQLEEYIHTTLGDERYAEYERSKDPAYRTINQIGTEAGLPKETILQAYQAQQQIQSDSNRILRDTTLTPEQRGQSLQEVRARAQETLQQLLGEKAAKIAPNLPDLRMLDRYGLIKAPVQIVNPTTATAPRP